MSAKRKSVSAKTVAKKPVKPPVKQTASVTKSNVPRHDRNPFRAGSSYGACFDILATFPEGLHKDKLIELLAKGMGKKLQNAKYDVAVVLSAKESANSQRHRSSKPGYYCKRVNDHVQLMLA